MLEQDDSSNRQNGHFLLMLLNDTHRVNSVIPYNGSIQYKNSCLADSDLSNVFIQSIKFYKFRYHILRSTDV